MKKDKSAVKPHRGKIKMPAEQKEKQPLQTRLQTTYPYRYGRLYRRNCTLPPPMPMECKHRRLCWKELPKDMTVYADKGYGSKENRQHLEEHRLLDGIMLKATANIRCQKRKPNATDICRRPVMMVEQSSVHCTVNSAMRRRCSVCSK